MLRRLFPRAVERFEDDYDTTPFGRRGRGHLRPHPAVRRTRWFWTVPLATGFLTVIGWVLAHDPAPGLAPSNRGWLQISLAGLLVLLLSLHRSDSTWRLVRMLAEYAAVALLAVLLVTPAGAQPAPASRQPAARARAAAEIAGDTCPSVAQFPAWLACLWHTGQEASRNAPPATTRPRKGHAMAPSPARPLGSKWG
jgi:hypothetical protein